MAFANKTSAVSLWKTIRRQVKGFGIRNIGLGSSDSSTEVFGARLRHDNMVLLIPLAGMLPLPTIFLDVSGRQVAIVVRHRPERMARNQKIHLQHAFSAKTPPRTGPKLSAVFGLASLNFSIILIQINQSRKAM